LEIPEPSSHPSGGSRVSPLETVERGYSQLVDRLLALGAKVAKVE